ncbi:MAG: type II toxin-antitoxin system VapC family toxin [Nitrospirae bacterium]|nr:type II toxin-antitoxin system VapC family toxin [Nitrospirota bacterium]
MIGYWDASAVVPLVVGDTKTSGLEAMRKSRTGMVTWWGTVVECASAIARMEREEDLNASEAGRAIKRLSDLRQSWAEVAPAEWLREHAVRLLRLHNLRAGDALQLAAAILASRNRPGSIEFVCLDKRLALAAEREGFRVIGP